LLSNRFKRKPSAMPLLWAMTDGVSKWKS
jgi:hypothetical protein